MKNAYAYLIFGLMALLFGPSGLAAQPADFATQAAAQIEEANKAHQAFKNFYIGITSSSMTPRAQPYPTLKKKLSAMGDTIVAMRNHAQSPLGASAFNADVETFQAKARDFEVFSKSYGLGEVKVPAYLAEIDSKISNRRDDVQKLRDKMDKASDKFDAATAQQLKGKLTVIESDWKALKTKADANTRALKGTIALYTGPGVTRNTMMEQTVAALRTMDVKISDFESGFKSGMQDFKADKKADKKAEKAEKAAAAGNDGDDNSGKKKKKKH